MKHLAEKKRQMSTQISIARNRTSNALIIAIEMCQALPLSYTAQQHGPPSKKG